MPSSKEIVALGITNSLVTLVPRRLLILAQPAGV